MSAPTDVNGKSAARAGLWSTLDLGFRQGVQFVASVILARLLLPADFGLIALVVFFSSFSVVFVQGGLPEALIQRRVITPEEQSSVFWWNVAGSVVFAAALVAAGPFLGRFYHAPALPGLMTLAAGMTICAALGGVHTALLVRELRFDLIAKAGVCSSLASAGAAVTAAWLGAGIWALGIQMATAAAVYTIAIWSISSWRPTFHFSLATIRHLLSFGGWLSLSTALETLYTQGFALLVGKLYGLSELGLYNRAAGTQQLPANVFSAVIARVAFPLLSMRSEDPAAMRAGIRKANGMAMLVNVPVMIGFVLLPDLVIEVLFGAKWLPAAPILAILAWSGVVFPLHVINLQVLLAQGRTRTYFRVEITKKLIGLSAVLVGSYFGIFGLAIAQLTASATALFINTVPTKRSVGYGLFAQLQDLAGVLVAAAAMAGVVIGLRGMLALPAVPQLAVLAGAGAFTYGLVGLAVPNRSFKEAWKIGRSLIGQSQQRPTGSTVP